MKKNLLVWICCGVLSAGFFNKSFDDGFRWSNKDKCEDMAARDQSISIMYGIIGGPISLIIVMTITGFGYKGWSLYKHECNY